MTDKQPENKSTPYEYSRCSYYHSSTSTDDKGRRVTSTWRGGYGHENKDGQTRYFVLPSEPEARFIESNEEVYNKTKEQVGRQLEQPVPKSLPKSSKKEPEQERRMTSLGMPPMAPFLPSRRLFSTLLDDMWLDPFGDEVTRLRRENAELRRQLQNEE